MARPEPMNATPHHSKAKVTLYFSDPKFVAGQHVTGKMEVECKADKGMGISEIKAELFAIQELTSRDHSATSTFLHSTCLFQGQGLPPSNAVYPHPLPGNEPLPLDYYLARKGTTTFFFRFSLPESSPSSIDFGKGLAKLKYEVRASVGVCWRNERQLVMERKEVDVVESPGEPSGDSEQVVVGENGKLWVQGRVMNPYVVAGESCCVELFVKNHSTKKNSSLTLTLSRHLHLPSLSTQSQNVNKALQISDTLTTVPFRGADYIVHPGTEGVASLVFNVPKTCRGVRSGRLEDGDPDDPRESESLFEVRCVINVKLGMGLGNKDVGVEIPVTVVNPIAMKAFGLALAAPVAPARPLPDQYMSPAPYAHRAISPGPYPPQPTFSPQPADSYPNPYPQYNSPPLSPPPNSHAYHWTPAPIAPTYIAYPPLQDQQHYYYPPPPTIPLAYPIRPSSADPFVARQLPVLPNHFEQQNAPLPLVHPTSQGQNLGIPSPEGEVGKGERASRISAHLRMTSRNRSVSPQSHRFPVVSSTIEASPEGKTASTLRNIATPHPMSVPPGNAEQDPQLLSASPRSNNEVLSPRPILSPKHSFTAERGTVKSERVVDLERMAAAEVALEERNHKSLPPRPPSAMMENEDAPKPPKLPPQPTLAPIATRPRPPLELYNRESGLEALERKLLEQVGTRKPEQERRPDVRTVMPISIPTHNDPRLASDPPNDSAISSFALGAEALNGWPGSASPARNLNGRRSSSPAPILMGLDNDNTDKETERRGRTKGREKQSKTHQLRKAATNRVAAWLGEIDPEVPPPPCETPQTDSPRVSMEDEFSSGGRDHDPHLLLRSSPVPSVPSPLEDRHEAVIEEIIPTRSSGFVLHAAPNSDSFDPPVSGAHSDSARGSTPTQQQSPISASPEAKHHKSVEPSPPAVNPFEPKPVLKRFTGLASPKEAKYDVRSARGGRGGKVTSVATLWASLAAQNPTPAKINENMRVNEKPGLKTPLVRPVQKPSLSSGQKANAHSKASQVARKPVPVDTNVADLTSRRAKMIKSASVPAVISSSLATPVLSSTASLARPLYSPTKRVTTPLTSEAESSSKTRPQAAALTITNTIAANSKVGQLNFGQARLKELIKKYQQGQ